MPRRANLFLLLLLVNCLLYGFLLIPYWTGAATQSEQLHELRYENQCLRDQVEETSRVLAEEKGRRIQLESTLRRPKLMPSPQTNRRVRVRWRFGP